MASALVPTKVPALIPLQDGLWPGSIRQINPFISGLLFGVFHHSNRTQARTTSPWRRRREGLSCQVLICEQWLSFSPSRNTDGKAHLPRHFPTVWYPRMTCFLQVFPLWHLSSNWNKAIGKKKKKKADGCNPSALESEEVGLPSVGGQPEQHSFKLAGDTL